MSGNCSRFRLGGAENDAYLSSNRGSLRFVIRKLIPMDLCRLPILIEVEIFLIRKQLEIRYNNSHPSHTIEIYQICECTTNP